MWKYRTLGESQKANSKESVGPACIARYGGRFSSLNSHIKQVVVRPADVSMLFSQFMDLLYSNINASFYLEYTSISSALPKLLEDIEELFFASKSIYLNYFHMENFLKKKWPIFGLEMEKLLESCTLTLSIIFYVKYQVF